MRSTRTVFRDTLSEGFSHFVTSMTAPVASGWSGCRAGLAPTGKRRLFTGTPISDFMQCTKIPATPLLVERMADQPPYVVGRSCRFWRCCGPWGP